MRCTFRLINGMFCVCVRVCMCELNWPHVYVQKTVAAAVATSKTGTCQAKKEIACIWLRTWVWARVPYPNDYLNNWMSWCTNGNEMYWHSFWLLIEMHSYRRNFFYFLLLLLLLFLSLASSVTFFRLCVFFFFSLYRLLNIFRCEKHFPLRFLILPHCFNGFELSIVFHCCKMLLVCLLTPAPDKCDVLESKLY